MTKLSTTRRHFEGLIDLRLDIFGHRREQLCRSAEQSSPTSPKSSSINKHSKPLKTQQGKEPDILPYQQDWKYLPFPKEVIKSINDRMLLNIVLIICYWI